jgi:hypothetical protein
MHVDFAQLKGAESASTDARNAYECSPCTQCVCACEGNVSECFVFGETCCRDVFSRDLDVVCIRVCMIMYACMYTSIRTVYARASMHIYCRVGQELCIHVCMVFLYIDKDVSCGERA